MMSFNVRMPLRLSWSPVMAVFDVFDDVFKFLWIDSIFIRDWDLRLLRLK
jgi:hypothetical protein